MKQNRKYNIFGWLAASALLLTTACSENVLDVAQNDVNAPNTVTFTIQPQLKSLGTRADGDLVTGNTNISDGTKADVLIFAVYEVETDEEGNITKYSENPAEEFSRGNQAQDIYNKELGLNQNAIKVDSYPITLQFVITDPGKKYQLAFWAQNSKTEAYNTTDLQKVMVNYNNAKNNDELRDAFCAVSEVVTSETKNKEIILRRPLAQVNVGTAGWDYEGAALLKPNPVIYTQSKMTLDGVAQCYNILAQKTVVDDENDEMKKTTATFSFDYLPAFINLSDEYKQSPSYLPYGLEEEFLCVDFNRDDVLETYKGWGDYNDYRKNNPEEIINGKFPTTEIYKYLSMCYVLVPEAEEGESGSVLQSVTFEIKGIENETDETAGDEGTGDEEDDDTDGADDVKKEIGEHVVFTINNVPVQSNWRTNILGSSFFTTAENFKVDIVPEYFGDYNYNGWDYGSPDGTGTDWPTDPKGIYYSMDFNRANEGDEYTVSAEEKNNGFFSFGDQENEDKAKRNKHSHTAALSPTPKYDNKSYTYGLKMEGSTEINFTTEYYYSTVFIVQYTGQGGLLTFDGVDLPLISATTPENSSNVRLYTLNNVSKGEHKIKKSTNDSTQPYVLYVGVQQYDIKDDTIDDYEQSKHPEKTE